MIANDGITRMYEEIADPGTGVAIPVTRSGICHITTAGGAETNTLAAPTFVGQTMTFVHTVDGGDRTITAATGLNDAGNTNAQLVDVGEAFQLVAIQVGVNIRWRMVFNEGATLT